MKDYKADNKNVYKEHELYLSPISKEDEKEFLGIIENQIEFAKAVNSLCDKLDI